MTIDVRDLNSLVRDINRNFSSIKHEVQKVIVGQDLLIERLLIALLSGGHLLLEGLPGLAKTLTVNTFSKIIQCQFKRIQFTPDLLPADLIGTSIYNPKDASFHVKQGPIFSNVLLADEINRAPAKVQSALLEVMAEKQVTIAGQSFSLDEPFMVMATQNPVEHEGTYPLPEAQTDRFMMKVKVSYPSKQEELKIIQRMTTGVEHASLQALLSIQDLREAKKIVKEVYVDEKVLQYILDVVFATRDPKAYQVDIEGLLDFGASPRASIALTRAAKAHAFLNGRGFVTPHDVKCICHDVLRHRLRLSYEAQAEELTTDQIIDRILNKLLVP